MDADRAEEHFTNTLLEATRRHIPSKKLKERKCTHPWLTEEVLKLVQKKRDAAGTPGEEEAAKECSNALFKEYKAWAQRTKEELASLKRGSKKWWAKTRELFNQKGKCSHVPALKNTKGEWVTEPKEKAQLFADIFSAKYELKEEETNKYIEPKKTESLPNAWKEPTEEDAYKTLSSLREESATGPDGVAARVLRKCAEVLTKSFFTLMKKVLLEKRWPEA